jgi:histone acetyltransferase
MSGEEKEDSPVTGETVAKGNEDTGATADEAPADEEAGNNKRKAEEMESETAADHKESTPGEDGVQQDEQATKKQKISADDTAKPDEEKKDDGTAGADDEAMDVDQTAAEEDTENRPVTQGKQPPRNMGAIGSVNEENEKDEHAEPDSAAKRPAEPAATSAKGSPYDELKYTMITNDGKPESLIKLVALKSLFSKQLPKMPRAYIARLIFDRRHVSLAILNDNPATKDTDEEVIGAICYRPFYDMRFAEIAFCAVNASHQVKGYGTKLMNLVKKEGARTGIEYFITYADNYAIGYFKKQGFTKNIAMPKGRYQGLIKDYDGGTMMECYVHPSIDFTRIPEMLAAQREFILSRIRLKAQSTKVYDPLPKDWKPDLEGVSRGSEAAARALAIPGMVEAGWTVTDLLSATGQGKDLDRAKNALKSELLGIVRKVEEQQFSWPFREPVDTNEVKDYLDIIKEPIDLSTIDKRIRKGDHYKSKKMLYADLMLMVNNCKLYNDEASTYMQCAKNLENYLKAMFANV